MATSVNRYTKPSLARFDPMKLEELMMVPAYKRQQHDNLSANLASVEAQLSQVDPLDIHSDLARQEQERLYNQLKQQSDRLATEGFSNTTKSDVLKLNKDYQQTIGPMGTIGKINAAKATLAKEKEAYIQNATKLGYSPEAAGQNWDDHVKKYGTSFDGKNVSNISSLYSPEYKDAVGEFKTLLKEAGMTSSDISNLNSNIVFDDTKGSYVLSTKGRTASSNNKKQLEAALDYMNNQIINPNSTINKSLKHNRKDPNDVLDEISGLNKVYEKTSYAEETSSQISNFTPLTKEDNDITANGSGLTVASTQYSPAKFTGKTYGDISSAIKGLEIKKQSGGLSKEEETTLLEMQDFQTQVDNELKNDDKFLELKTTLDNYKNGNFSFNPELKTKFDIMRESAEKLSGINRQQVLNNIEAEKVQAINSLEQEISDYTKPIINETKLKVTEYAVTPLTSKQRTSFNIINENADRLLRVSPQSLEQLGDIRQIIDPNGNPRDITSKNDTKGIANLIFQSKPGSVEVVSYVARGVSGKPEVVFRVNTDENNKYDMDGLSGSSDNLGGGKPLQVRLAFDTTNNEVNVNGKKVNNILGLLQDYVASTGPVGREFVESQKINQAKSKYAGQTWGDLQQQGVDDSEAKLLYTQKLREEGITSTSRDEEIIAAQNRLKNIKIKR